MTQTTLSPDTSAVAIDVTASTIPETSQLAPTHPPHRFNPREPLSYDPEAIIAHYKRRPLQVLGRLLMIIGPFVLFFLRVGLIRKGAVSEKRQRRQAERLRRLLTNLGPAYIKIGQALSTRPDLVPPIYLEELTRLQDQLPAFPNEVAFRFIEE